MTSRISKTAHKGFTLIELLVVISIIAILMAILMPALAKVKEQARRMTCATNMHTIGAAINLYAQDSDNYIPPMNLSDSKGANGTGTQRTNMWTRMLRRSDIGVGTWGPWWNLGFLWSGKYLETGEVFYCTSKSAVYEYNVYSTPKFPTDYSSAVRVSYTYNPICKSTTDRNRQYNRIQECGSTTLLMTDLLTDSVNSGVSHQGPGWNLLWGDGHISFRKSPHVIELINKDWYGFQTTNYLLFDMVLDTLITGQER